MESSTKNRYNQLTVDRQAALDKARRASKVTMYGLIPEEDDPSPSNVFKNSFSSFGNDAVGSLTTKLLYSVLPPSQQFFRKQVESTDFTDEELKILKTEIKGEGTIEEKIKRVLIRNSKKIQNYFEEKGIRSTYNETLMNLIVAGNVVVKYTKDGARNYKLNNFVIVRDNESNLIIELIVKEKIFREELTQEQISVIDYYNDYDESKTKTYDLYTHVKLNDGGFDYTITQEIEGANVHKQDPVPVDELPFVAPRLYKDSDSNYGESYVYRFFDDLRDLNNYRKQYISATASLTRILYLVDPRAATNPRDLSKKKNGEFAVGKKDDVSTLQADNIQQIEAIGRIIDSIENKLRGNFLMLNVRKSERTTAEEVRAVQEELDQQLGGVFSTVSQELQLPSVKSVEAILVDYDDTYVYLPGTQDKIITGVEAIGRSQEAQKYRSFIALIAEGAQIKPELVDYIDEEWLAEQLLKASGVDEEAILQTSKVIEMRQARNQQAQQAAMQQQMLESGGKMAENSVNNMNKQQQ